MRMDQAVSIFIWVKNSLGKQGISNIESRLGGVQYSLFYSMDIVAFTKTLSENNPPPSLSVHLAALWYDGKGDWNTAHGLINDLEDKESAWVHAYLHRKEGDIGNAGYWYRRAGKDVARISLQEEWKEIAEAFLNR